LSPLTINILKSAGVLSPVESFTISPGTKPDAFIFYSYPSLITVHFGGSMFLNLAITSPAVFSIIKETVQLKKTKPNNIIPQ